MTRWEKERLTEQLKFFGAKKTKFISCYAKKPRISMKEDRFRVDLRPNPLVALYQDQLNRGMQNSTLGYGQMAAMGQAQLGGGLQGFYAGSNHWAAAQQQQQMGLMGGLGTLGGQFI